MSVPDGISILFPLDSGVCKSHLKSTFVVVGFHSPTIGGVPVASVTVDVLSGTDPRSPILKSTSTSRFRQNRPDLRVRWGVVFNLDGEITARREVRINAVAKDAAGRPLAAPATVGSVCLIPRGRPLIPEYDWPPTDPYTLDPSETSSFICCGFTDSNITALTWNTSVYPVNLETWLGDQFWWGEFVNLTTETAKPLVVTNATGPRTYSVAVP